VPFAVRLLSRPLPIDRSVFYICASYKGLVGDIGDVMPPRQSFLFVLLPHPAMKQKSMTCGHVK